jgi:hypothetical protein
MTDFDYTAIKDIANDIIITQKISARISNVLHKISHFHFDMKYKENLDEDFAKFEMFFSSFPMSETENESRENNYFRKWSLRLGIEGRVIKIFEDFLPIMERHIEMKTLELKKIFKDGEIKRHDNSILKDVKKND